MIKRLLVSWVEARIRETIERERRVVEKTNDMSRDDPQNVHDAWYLKGRLDAFGEIRELLTAEDKL